ncbi:hypothetical protein [Mycobacterium sp. OTB74]|jgi:hypothetical protein|uniref:hypothetical protein n=1 Tax=Mycobacterium sp. OTB74 TaxID=1853452 RepID=UPI002472F63C|nr:hypothetical protein [Mycobacterium sp. OTB74]MDH6243853.1 hypothetical protein [Mycobacterium sp. OTB74]
MVNKIAMVGLVSIGAVLVGCSTQSEPSKAPSNDKSTTAAGSTSGSAGNSPAPKAALDAVRGAGVEGNDGSLNDLISIACVFSGGNTYKSTQELANQMAGGGKLSPEQAEVIVKTALQYSCPENAGKFSQ